MTIRTPVRALWVTSEGLVGTFQVSHLVLFFTKMSHSFSKVPAAAATAAKSLQSCPTLQPHRRQPTRLPHPWDSPGKNTGVVCYFLLQCMKVIDESEVAQSAAYQAPLPMGFSRQEYWSGSLVPSPILSIIGHICQSQSLNLSLWKL